MASPAGWIQLRARMGGNCRQMVIGLAIAWLSTLVPGLAVGPVRSSLEAGAELELTPDRALSEGPVAVRYAPPPPGVRVRFTTDGSEPTLRNGSDATAPWSLTQSTLLRVAAFSNGVAITPVSTHSYLILDDILKQPSRPPGLPRAWDGEAAHYAMDPRVVSDPRFGPRMKAALRALPTLSLVCDPRDLFDDSRGLYVNTQERGDAWERRCSLEWIGTNGASGFQIDCGFRIQGNTGRNPDKTPKHSFRLVFRKSYGASKLQFPVFPDSPVDRFDSLVLRADYNNAWTHWKPEDNERAQRIRDAWLKDSHRAMGYPAAHNRYVHLYLNGLYWGIYDLAERPDAGFAASYLGGKREDYDVLDDSGLKSGAEGSVQDYRRLLRPRQPLTWEQAAERTDPVHFIDYVLLNYYAGNEDWGEQKNWYVIRRHGPDARFRHYVWDGEITLQSLRDDVVNHPDRPPLVLCRQLSQDPEYRLAFADRVQRHCFGDGALTPEASARRWRLRAAEVELPLLAESARWGAYRRDPPFTLDDWHAEKTRLLTGYFPKRTQVLLKQLRTAGLYPAVPAPSLQRRISASDPSEVLLSPEPGGPETRILHLTRDGHDPRTPGTGEPSPSSQILRGELSVRASDRVRVRARVGSDWSALVELPPSQQ
ncbi:MAG: CotH kinase family protein [Verrucomicrobiales bacterium]|nr:CotH kinase family protein [Verrucomicrobiales bacterium]